MARRVQIPILTHLWGFIGCKLNTHSHNVHTAKEGQKRTKCVMDSLCEVQFLPLFSNLLLYIKGWVYEYNYILWLLLNQFIFDNVHTMKFKILYAMIQTVCVRERQRQRQKWGKVNLLLVRPPSWGWETVYRKTHLSDHQPEDGRLCTGSHPACLSSSGDFCNASSSKKLWDALVLRGWPSGITPHTH